MQAGNKKGCPEKLSVFLDVGKKRDCEKACNLQAED